MPLDPLVKAFLDKAAATPRPRAWDMTPGQVRQAFTVMMQQTGPKDVAVGKIQNLSIPGRGGEIRARGYTPIAAVGPQPTLIYFHGGGFVAGGGGNHDGLLRRVGGGGGVEGVAGGFWLGPGDPYSAGGGGGRGGRPGVGREGGRP